MKKVLLITVAALTLSCLCLSNFSNGAFAGQIAALSRSDAEKAAAVLKEHEEARKLCEPAGHFWPTYLGIYDGNVEAYNSGERWFVRVNGEDGEDLDPAYVYIDGGGRWVNLALHMGLEVKGVTKSFIEPKLWISEPASGYVKLTVTGGGNIVRGLPGPYSPVVSNPDEGDILIAEAKTINSDDDNSEWYRIVAFTDDGGILKLASNSHKFTFIHPVIPADQVMAEPLDEDLAAKMEWYNSGRGTPPEQDSYYIAGSARDWSEKAQRELAEEGLPVMGSALANRIAITDPSTAKGDMEFLLDEKGELRVLAICSKIVGRTEWYLLTDNVADPIGWVRARDFRVRPTIRPERDRFYYHYINLCRNLDAGISAFGPLIGRRQNADYSPDMEIIVFPVVQDFDGANLLFNVFNWNDMSIYPMGGTIWRKGAGVCGIFIGAEWCDKAYVRQLLSEPTDIKESNDGEEEWLYFTEMFELWVTFDEQGLVKQLYVYMVGD
ncbi:MAG: hypothetical protein FWE49_05565 [Synergistaceae bacterium]|nr:hypothetical protein [Synergistaceae bacterium]